MYDKNCFNSRLHCIRKILNGEADFGVFQPEEISYATRWNDYLSVTNEIRLFEIGSLLIIYFSICLYIKKRVTLGIKPTSISSLTLQ